MIKAIDPVDNMTLNAWTVQLFRQQIGKNVVSLADINRKGTEDANQDATGGSATIIGIGIKMDLTT